MSFLIALAGLFFLFDPGREMAGFAATAKSPAAAAKGRPAGASTPAPSTPPPAGPAPRIEWWEWGQAAFQRAQQFNRPILLNVVVSWSRQCRQMEATWSDRRIVGLVNQRFVPVRVDADRHPEVRDRYPSGDWPSVTILVPTGEPIYFAGDEAKGAPARMRFGLLPAERVRPILQDVLLYYHKKRDILIKAMEKALGVE